MTPHQAQHPAPITAQELKQLEAAYLEEIRATQPDIARMRALRAAINSARRRLERAHGVLPPHTD